jgi:hypothetical protein
MMGKGQNQAWLEVQLAVNERRVSPRNSFCKCHNGQPNLCKHALKLSVSGHNSVSYSTC